MKSIRLIFMFILILINTATGNSSFAEIDKEYYSIIKQLKSVGGENAQLNLYAFYVNNDYHGNLISDLRASLLEEELKQDTLMYESIYKKEKNFNSNAYNPKINKLITDMDYILKEYNQSNFSFHSNKKLTPVIKKLSDAILTMKFIRNSPNKKEQGMKFLTKFLEIDSKLSSSNKYKKEYFLKTNSRRSELDEKMLIFSELRLNKTKEFAIFFKKNFRRK